ncbi:MAG: DUF2203 family protein [Chloroflexi bacterium]|nr:DUF2203 family protein [Chloroflexota bacterium]
MDGVDTRFFTPDEANQLLVELRPLVERMRLAYGTLHAARARLTDLAEKAVAGGGSRMPPHLMQAGEQLESSILAIRRHGVVIKDLSSGLIDFPAEYEGRPIFLCWRPGESAVGYWHEVEGGFDGRRPLEPDR